MITSEQVADLREGDVVEIQLPRWPSGTRLSGPLSTRANGLYLADELVQWCGAGDKRIAWMLADEANLTVISRAPRPLYVNHPRTEPVHRDIVVDRDRDAWQRKGNRWYLPGGSHEGVDDISDCAPLILLVDGETGQAVP